ncbi:hypothetical protein H5410_039819 [Solanum commersonii]|uniref:Helitron helicase-like domain-containing protein n=1 Tax=Solanum commersonii TaxID=4109 RepID=A0A9J5XM31_SOLCO|nr:hypothetical protein H5410_039819 [Solanum commersonii]
MYTIEFQKRGLPYAHFLIILEEKYKIFTLEAYDQFVCAELPDPKRNPHLFELVSLHMIHGPCGPLNPTCPCMKKKVRNTRQFIKNGSHLLDNSWVVPYNSYLLCKFNCHINVEISSDIKIVKYIYKYICKGHDKIAFNLHTNNTNIEIDEIK